MTTKRKPTAKATAESHAPAPRLEGHKTRRSDPGLLIETLDNPGPGGAHHVYRIAQTEWAQHPWFAGSSFSAEYNARLGPGLLLFQHGCITDASPANGLTIEALLVICAHRLMYLQNGAFACGENSLALQSIDVALGALHSRTRSRIRRGVEGKEVK